MRVHEAAKELGVSPWSIRKYCNNGELQSNRTPGGQRNITPEQLKQYKINKGLQRKETDRKIAFYIRSSSGNKELLQAQITELEQHYGKAEKIYKDSASGLNENRKGLQQLLKDVEQSKYDAVCVTYQDRLTRFGFSYLEHIIKRTGTELIVLHEKKKYSLEQELMEDFMSLIASFSGRFYRIRGKKQQLKLLEDVSSRIDNEK